MAISNLVLYSLIAIVSYAIYKRATKFKPPAPYPPGPKPVPLLGNVFDLSGKELWIETAKWAEEYGLLFSISFA